MEHKTDWELREIIARELTDPAFSAEYFQAAHREMEHRRAVERGEVPKDHGVQHTPPAGPQTFDSPPPIPPTSPEPIGP